MGLERLVLHLPEDNARLDKQVRVSPTFFVVEESATGLPARQKKSLVWGELCILRLRRMEITVEIA